MSANPIDSVAGLASAADVSKSDFRTWAKGRVSQVFADATEIRNTTLAGQSAICLKTTGKDYYLDGTDTTTADDGLTCIISNDGKRFKLASGQFVLDTDAALGANSDARVASQKAVKSYVDQIVGAADAMVFKGVINCSASPNYPAADRGWTYKVSAAGKIGGASGTNVEVGDTLFCITDGTASGTQAGVGASWNIIQANMDGGVTGPATAVGDNVAAFNGTSGKIVKDSGKPLAALPSAVGQLPGTTTNDNASAGNVGEFLSSSGTGVALTPGGSVNIASRSLPPGDWDVEGIIAFGNSGATTYTAVLASVSTTSATRGSLEAGGNVNIAGATHNLIAPRTRLSLASTTTVYLVAFSQSSGGSPTGAGTISARRVR
ncbi:hypothetical protein [Bradyrhizobium sp. HKCCYLR20261]|uniref:hypothetical protein n=1 Tax=Bradyrhizobium sp. HKCCYLR20261 TaxID=3420760 RepID=UPI003EB87207